MHAGCGGQNDLEQHVKSADMHQLMRQGKPHFLAVAGRDFGEDYNRIYNSVGQRRDHTVAYLYCYFAAEFCLLKP